MLIAAGDDEVTAITQDGRKADLPGVSWEKSEVNEVYTSKNVQVANKHVCVWLLVCVPPNHHTVI